MDPQRVLGFVFEKTETCYEERDVVLYALSTGALDGKLEDLAYSCTRCYSDELRLRVLPTFAVLFQGNLIDQFLSLDGLVFDPTLLLHGEQHLELFAELSPQAKVSNQSKVTRLEDKGKAALIEIETTTHELSSGKLLAINKSVCFLRGAGGFSTPNTKSMVPSKKKIKKSNLNQDKPLFVVEEKTLPSQALLYRLNGDYNPLHSDPEFAHLAGFERPILHGLCTFGFVARAIISTICGGSETLLKAISGRFLHHVFPGETLETSMWLNNGRIDFLCKVKERGINVLSGTASCQVLSMM